MTSAAEINSQAVSPVLTDIPTSRKSRYLHFKGTMLRTYYGEVNFVLTTGRGLWILDKSVADVADGLDIGVAGVLDFTAQTAYMNAPGGVAAEIVVAPGSIGEGFAGKDAALI